MRLTLVALALLLALGPATADESASFAPSASIALESDAGRVVVAWEPGEELADSYRVFGLDDGGKVFLAEWTPTSDGALNITVPSGFSEYGVAGVKNDVQSEIVKSHVVNLGDRPCVTVVLDVPPRYYIWCVFGLPLPARIALMWETSILA